MTQNERLSINAKRRSKPNWTNHLYSSWMGAIRSMGIEDGMTLSQVREQFSHLTIGEMFNDGVSSRDAYRKISGKL